MTAADEVFRTHVREFVRAHVPPDMAARTRHDVHATKEDLQRWNRILYEQGWAAPHWPMEYGGTGWTPLQIHIFEEECAAADAPFMSYFGLRLIGPLIYTFGSAEHKNAHLEDILRGDVFWCQGFSEPSSGSDLASVRTTAVRDGDTYVINGQKLWTTEAHYADKMFCLARTDPDIKPQKGGLTIFFIDMKQPGVTVRPVITIDEGHSVNEVFLDNVRVPASDVLGEEGQGWAQAKFLLGNERVTNAHVPRAKRDLVLLKRMVSRAIGRGVTPTTEARLSERIARLEIDLAVLEWSVLRELSTSGRTRSQISASGLKILGSELQQRMSDLAIDVVGPQGLIFFEPHHDPSAVLPGGADDELPGLAARQLFFRATTIYAGTNEIQHEIIAREVF
ncbi:acyl-CoA dehydrogenase family protein [Castellaniella sp.]|uniref:acyl-CoA dehydrogenase family protein n=1 Tax=Castellaniella sp. TaxID=1955812 RepID=UPI00355ECAC2